MIDKGIVQGSEAQAKPLVVGLDTVYVHTDIRQITTEDGSVLYEYHEVQYEKDEYIKLMVEQLVVMQTDIDDLQASQAQQDLVSIELFEQAMEQEAVNNAQDAALVDIYEMMMGGGETV